jgi:Fic family protein
LDDYYADAKPEYYAALHECQGSAFREDADITSWVGYFVRGFLSSARILSAELTIMALLATDAGHIRMNLEEADLLSYAKQFGGLSISDACDILKHTPRRTVQRKLKKLVDEGALAVSGAGKSTVYKWRE